MEPDFRSITTFLTDGSLAALCAAISRLTGARIALIDPKGREIVMGTAERPWRVEPEDERALALGAALRATGGDVAALPDGGVMLPIVVRAVPIGAITVSPAGDDERSDLLAFALEMLASTIGEFCEQAVEIHHSHHELRVLFRLSSLLVGARDVGAILKVALASSIEVFGMEAASVHLADEESGKYLLRAHTGLPDEFVARVAVLTGADGLVNAEGADRAAPASVSALAEGFGLGGVVSVSLVFQERATGVLRLYSREPRLLEPNDTALLQTIAEQVAAAVSAAGLIEAERQSAVLRRQLELAGDVQHRMLPRTPTSFPKLDIAARYLPSFELSGDFYDLIDLSGHLAVAIGDVSGKGVPAALLMAAARATIRAHAQDVFHLDELMSRVNKAMARDTLPQEFATVFYGVIDPKSLRLTYCNAGHDPPLIVRPAQAVGKRPAGERVHELRTGGMIVGVDPGQTYERGMFDLAPGDVLALSTDGLTDAMNFQGDKFGRDRLRASLVGFLDSAPKAPAREIADHLVWEVRRFIGLNAQTDDITLVVIRAR